MRIAGLISLGLVSSIAAAQGSISIFGQMAIGQGGSALASGKVRDSANGPVGYFKIAFTTGALVSMETNTIARLFVPSQTAGYEGIATALIRENNVTQAVTGRYHVYVDDLSGMTPPHPDQMVMTFQPRVGPMIVRHGVIQRGDIIVTP